MIAEASCQAFHFRRVNKAASQLQRSVGLVVWKENSRLRTPPNEDPPIAAKAPSCSPQGSHLWRRGSERSKMDLSFTIGG